MSSKKITTLELVAMKERGDRIAVLTAYDFLMAGLVDEAGVDCVLVGDSLGQVVAGEDSTLPVTLDQMIYHARAVRRGLTRALLVVDMPQAVKLEGGHEEVARTIRRLVDVGIPVMGHLGLTPQSVNTIGGYRLVGRADAERERLLADAQRLVDAGCFSMVLEMLPSGLAGEISRSIPIPTIGIGAGPECDGQVLVLPDMLGLNEGFNPGFLKKYSELAAEVRRAVAEYVREVREGQYPDSDHSYD
jgi:3-methyl-2-oxobutanoate hydroxymethyltransferase